MRSDLFTKRYGMNNFITFLSPSTSAIPCPCPIPRDLTRWREKEEKKRKIILFFRVGEESLITSCFLLFCFFSVTESFIVPQEIPSLLSLVYSNIPPIKKGNKEKEN